MINQLVISFSQNYKHIVKILLIFRLNIFSKFRTKRIFFTKFINPLNTKLNPICHLQALLGAHHILHFSRIRVNKDNFIIKTLITEQIQQLLCCLFN